MNLKHDGESVNNHESYFIMPLSPVKFVKQIAVCGLICEKLLKFLLLSRAALLERSCDWVNFIDFHYNLCVDFKLTSDQYTVKDCCHLIYPVDINNSFKYLNLYERQCSPTHPQ